MCRVHYQFMNNSHVEHFEWWEKYPGPQFNIKMTSYQYRKSHCGDKTILRPSYLHNGISYTDKMTSLYWIKALTFDCFGFCCAAGQPLRGQLAVTDWPDNLSIRHSGAGVGVTKPISSVSLFSDFSALSKHTLDIEYHVNIWQVSPQLSCQIWMRFKESKRYFCKFKYFA